MRISVVVAFFLGISMILAGSPNQEAGENQRLSYWRQYLAGAGDLGVQSSDQKIELLGNVLRGIGSPENYRYAGPDAVAFQKEVQAALLAIPGHARALAEEVERSREPALKEKSIAGMKYNTVRSKYLSEILRHLPSPETIQVLGHYLDDERDTPPEELPYEGEREMDVVSTPENAWLALFAISNLGLRDAPIEPRPSALSGGYRHGPEATAMMRSAREWYAEVKEGKKPFSFIGEKEEHRFKPDGTWVTTALVISDDEIAREKKPLAVIPSAPPSAPAEQIAPDSSLPTSRWAWWVAGATVLVAAGAWLARNRHKNA